MYKNFPRKILNPPIFIKLKRISILTVHDEREQKPIKGILHITF